MALYVWSRNMILKKVSLYITGIQRRMIAQLGNTTLSSISRKHFLEMDTQTWFDLFASLGLTCGIYSSMYRAFKQLCQVAKPCMLFKTRMLVYNMIRIPECP
jgi:hypothetical protein